MHVGHTGKHACERCHAIGESIERRITFNNCQNKNLRSGENFTSGHYLETHKKKISPLVEVIDCVSQFPHDYMHLVLFGIVKRMLNFLIGKGPKTCRISNQHSTLISEQLMCNNGKMPSEFNRQPRALSELCYWKATELRQFLLYHGPIILKGVVSDAIYKHFLALHVAM